MRSAQGSITELEKGKRYLVRVEFPRGEDGKRRQVQRTVRGSRKDAESKKIELLIEAGEDVQSLMTVTQYCEQIYLPAKMKTLKVSAYETYERRIRNHVEPGVGNVKLAELTPAQIRRWLKTKTPKVEKECRRMLHMICQEAVYDDHLTSNPVDRVKPIKVDKYDPEVLDAEDIEVYLWHFKDMRSEPAVLIAIGCGLRRGEIVALDVDDINSRTGAIRVDNSIVPTKRHGDLDDTTKTQASVRTVHMPKPLLDRLLEILPSSGPVIRNYNGTRMKAASLTHTYERDRDLLPEGVPRISLRNLRHTSLTFAYETTGDIEAAKERAGHTNISITTRFYVRPTGERDRRAADAMGEALSVNPTN